MQRVRSSLWQAGTLCLLLTACQAPQARVPLPPPDAAELLGRYNQRADMIPRIWARAVVEAEWIDDRGRKQSEQGDGQLFVRKPRDVALTVGKVGSVYYWIGGNEDRFWWFDENPHDEFPNTAYVGRHEDLARADMPRLSTPVPPDQLVELLGITRLPDDATRTAMVQPPRGSDAAAVWFHIPASLASGKVEQRVLVGAISARPLAIQFVEPGGALLAEARLTGYRPMSVPGAPYGAWPSVATRVEVRMPQRQSKMVLYLERPTADEKKFKDALFDFQTLVQSRRPEQVRELQPGPPGGASGG